MQAFFQIAYEGDFWYLCTVTFSQKVDLLICNDVSTHNSIVSAWSEKLLVVLSIEFGFQNLFVRIRANEIGVNSFQTNMSVKLQTFDLQIKFPIHSTNFISLKPLCLKQPMPAKTAQIARATEARRPISLKVWQAI